MSISQFSYQMMFRYRMMFLWLAIASVPAGAVDTLQVTSPDPVLEKWRWTEFDKSSGLVGNVMSIYEDRAGNIWFATDQGVQRYDGQIWTTYTTADGLAHNLVRTVYQTRDGAMWFGTTQGLCRFDGKDWTIYTKENGLPANETSRWGLHQARDGTLWAGFMRTQQDTSAGSFIGRFEGKTWTTVQISDDLRGGSIGDIHEASDGSMWFVNRGQGLLRYDGSNWTPYTTQTGLAGNSTLQILEARDGSLWFTCWTRGVSRFDGQTWQTYSTTEDLLPGSTGEQISSLWQAKDGAIWVSSHTGTLYRFDGESWRYFTTSDLRLGLFLRAETTREGSVWIWSGGGSSKVFRFHPDGGRWTIFSDISSVITPSFATGDVLFTIDDEVWLGGEDGAVRYDGKTWIKYQAEDGLIDGRITTILKAKDGNLWVAGQHQGKSGAARFDGQTWHVFSVEDGLVGKNIYTGYAASNGDVWFGTKGEANARAEGVMRYDGQAWTNYTTEDGLVYNTIYTIAETPDSAMWFGTNYGLSRFEGGVWTSHKTLEGELFMFSDNLQKRLKIRTLFTDLDGNLWMGHDHNNRGVTRYDGKTWTRYTTEDGLGNEAVWVISQSRDGTLWFGTEGGLSRFDGKTWHNYSRDEIPLLTGEAIRSIGETSDGALWLRGELDHSTRVVRFMPDRDAPETSIEQGLEQVSSDGNIVLEWSGHDPWNKTPSTKMHYQWRMDGGNWSSPSHRMAFTFTSLSVGAHQFEVRAKDKDGNVDAIPALHAFIVQAPWWMNPYLLGFAGVLLGLVGVQTGRVVRRDKRLREANEAMSNANKELFQVNVDLQREQVLERLRGQAQGMQSSEDIGPMVEAVYRELTELGLPLIQSAIDIMISDTEKEEWSTAEDGRALEPIIVKRPISKNPARENWKRGDSYFHHHFDGKGRKEEIRQAIADGVESRSTDLELGRIFGNPRWKGIPEARWPQEAESYTIFFDGGYVALVSEEPIDEDHLMLIKRFGEVFEYAHSRREELKQKEAQNRRLAVDACVQRLRAEVQSMDEVSDFEHILSLLSEGLETVELRFDGCEIDVLDELVENPTMDLFEAKGFRYTTYTLDPSGSVGTEFYNLSAPFPRTTRQNIERFNAGASWQGTSEGEAIVEVPAGSYGRLRLTATGRDNFTEEEITTLREFADAVALGYTRYLDIRQIQEGTKRKSAFLASMSHELRTPMNAIKGFTNLVLRREKELSDRNRENLEKVTQASDHLLAMINDILDLSKIEAGRMDVNPEPFHPKALVATCCTTVSPLLEEKPNVKLEYEVAEDVEQANTDQGRIRQMLINLLSNAIKFTDSGSVTVLARQENDQLVLSVSDTGQGIPEDELSTVFDEYRQVKGSDREHRGTGLGLSITKQFAELLDGTIFVESQVGKGSTFTVRVPVVYAEG